MKSKVISLQMAHFQVALGPNAISIDQHIESNISNGELTLKLKSADGVAIGKAFMQLMSKIDITKCHAVTLNVNSAADLQFVTMYLAAPPGKEFTKRFGSDLPEGMGRKLIINLQNQKASNQIFNLITNTVNGKCGLLQDFIPYFAADVEFKMPTGSKDNLMHQLSGSIDAMKANIKKSDLTAWDKTKAFAELDGTKYEIEDYINSHVVFDRKLEDAHVIKSLPRVQNVSNREIEDIINGKTMHVRSDETTHISLEEDTIVLVDAGNPSTSRYVEKLARSSDADKLSIFLTHFHNDHTAGLKETLRVAKENGLKVDINIPQNIIFQSVGFFATNYPDLDFASFNIIPMSETEVALITDVAQVEMFSTPPSISHFITSKGFVQSNGESARCYSGDINPGAFDPQTQKPYRTGKLVEGLSSYFSELITSAARTGAKKVDVFVDRDHFLMNPPAWTFINDFFKGNVAFYQNKYNVTDAVVLAEDLGIKLNYHFDHEKNNVGYDIGVE